MKFNQSEQIVLKGLINGGGKRNSPRIGEKRIENAINSLKTKGWIIKEKETPFLKLGPKAWQNLKLLMDYLK